MTLPMKEIPGVPDAADLKPGMAYFSDTGPYATTCGQCKHRGYFRPAQRYNKTRDIWEDYRRKTNACTMYKKLSGGRDGPPVDADWHSCKYYEAKEPP